METKQRCSRPEACRRAGPPAPVFITNTVHCIHTQPPGSDVWRVHVCRR